LADEILCARRHAMRPLKHDLKSGKPKLRKDHATTS
jgi:hypothetical protein